MTRMGKAPRVHWDDSRAVLLLTLALLIAIPLSAAAPRITRNSPIGVIPGNAVELTFSGDNLEKVTNIWASFPCEYSKVKGSASETVFRITAGSNVPPQIGLVRLATTNELSDLHLLLVDDLRSIAKRDARKGSPQVISPGVALDGATEEMQLDFFVFKAKKNEELSFDLFARRIGSALDPILRLLDPKGRELIYSLQTSEPNGDPRFRLKAPESGNYTIELRDVSYRGGANYFYRLRFGHFPLITACFPAVVETSRPPSVKLLGPLASIPAGTNGSSRIPRDSGQSLPFFAESRDNTGSGFISALTSDAQQMTESEPNDKADQATKIKIPAAVNGRFVQPRDRDYYEFDVSKDDRLAFTGQTRSLGSPCDLSMRLFDTNGTQVAESVNTTASEGSLTHPFDKAGKYRLLVEELTGAAAADFVYHIDVKRQPAGFSLSVESDKAERTTNGLFSLNVACARDRYDGAIKLSIVSKESFSLENATIAAKKTNTTVRIKLPSKMPPTDLGVVRIIGEATIRDQPFTDIASTMPALRKAFPMLLYPPVQFDGLVWLGPK